MSVLQSPHVFGLLIVALTSALVYGLQYTLEPENSKKTLYKTLAAGVLSTVVVPWFVYRPQAVLTEPFVIDA